VKKLNKLSIIVVVAASMLVCLGSTRNILADTPQIRNVIVWNDGGSTKLNVTVYHNGEVPDHYVDTLSVTVTSGTNLSQTFPQSGPHALDPDTLTFNVTLDIGLVSDAPLATVRAHCNIHGWSSQNWTGVVPEYSQLTLLLMLVAVVPVALLVHKIRRNRA
jgi:hypothetical protein